MRTINSKKELKDFLNKEYSIIKDDCHGIVLHLPLIICEEQIKYRIIKYLRKAEYHTNVNHKIRGFFYRLKLFNIETKYCMLIPMNVIDKGLNIAHIGNIMINDNAKIGKNVKIYPNIVVGNNEFKSHTKCPTIGNNVFIGTGAKLFGDIKVADNCIIAANSVVTKSINQKNSVIGGIPGSIIKKHNYYIELNNHEY